MSGKISSADGQRGNGVDEDLEERSTGDPAAEDRDEGQEVLQVFGVKLKVYNPHLAELLTMDAGDALTTDVVELVRGGAEGDLDVSSIPSVGDSQAAPVEADADSETHDLLMEQLAALEGEPAADVPAPVAGPADAQAASAEEVLPGDTQEMLARIGQDLGFAVEPGGVWRSSSGVIILVRFLDHPVAMDVATRLANELAEAQQRVGREAAGLFVVEDQMAADVFRVAIRQSGLYHEMRVVARVHLDDMLKLTATGNLSHRQVVALLVPLANIDVGELMNVIRAMGRSFEHPEPSA
jgi:hypothetical protein